MTHIVDMQKWKKTRSLESIAQNTDSTIKSLAAYAFGASIGGTAGYIAGSNQNNARIAMLTLIGAIAVKIAHDQYIIYRKRDVPRYSNNSNPDNAA